MPDLTRAFDALEQLADLVGVPAIAPARIETFTIGQVVNQYRDTLLRWSFDAMLGTMDRLDLARAMRALIRSIGRDVFLEGLREGGLRNPYEDMDDEEEARIEAWIADQLGYVTGFARAAAEVRDADDIGRARSDVLARVEVWAAALEALGREASALARKNLPGTWRLGRTEKHCDTCGMLNGKRRRLRWFIQNGYIPRQPGSKTLRCGGWRCDCGIWSDDGFTRLL